MNKLSVSICVPAYNEEKNIARVLYALTKQKTNKIRINKIVIVASGSTDNTPFIAKEFAKSFENILFIHEKERNGKASAINEFLKVVDDEVVVIESADTIPNDDTIENLCSPFLSNEKLGMTGGAPIPTNDKNTFIGYIVHSWWWFHRNIPRFGEIIAYRNILPEISATTAVDEAFIQAKLIKQGYNVVHIDTARVSNKGPENINDLLKQRRRIFNGHARLMAEEEVKIDNMTTSSIHLLLFKFKINNLKELAWFTGGILLEVYARILGYWDNSVKKTNPFVWDTATSTKSLNITSKNKKI